MSHAGISTLVMLGAAVAEGGTLGDATLNYCYYYCYQAMLIVKAALL